MWKKNDQFFLHECNLRRSIVISSHMVLLVELEGIFEEENVSYGHTVCEFGVVEPFGV